MLHEFDPETAEAIRASLPEDLLAMADSAQFEPTSGVGGRHWAADTDRQGQGARSSTATLSRQGDEG